MYLKTCWLENTGPISQLSFDFPFSVDRKPKPVVLVGSNGTGKTVVLSYIADALVEVAKLAYQDVVPGQGTVSPYLRVISNANQKVGTNHSFALLSLEAETDSNASFFYYEQLGQIPDYWNIVCEKNYGRTFPWNDRAKKIDGIQKDTARKAFEGASNCYFPFSRFERPHWQNTLVTQAITPFDLGENFRDRLGTRPIIVTEATSQNQSWLLHVFLDARADFIPSIVGNNVNFTLQGRETELIQRYNALNNVNSVLQSALRDSGVQFAVLSRTRGLSRIGIAKDNSLIIPSLHNLSTGQAILLNTFLTIIRYADRNDVVKVASLEEIEGIVLIDEIDAHMHSELQYYVLPSLIKLFPKVQFIVTSHSPLFVLGMEREFGNDGYLLLEMPEGNGISAERFSEFQKSFEYYQRTKHFEDEQRDRLRNTLTSQSRPLVLTEGDTDPDYIRTALELLGFTELLSIIDIEWIGAYRNGQPFFTGDKNLNNASEFFRANPKFIEGRRLLLLYDCDTDKPASTENNLWIRTIPRNEANNDIKKGIENLLPISLFNPNDTRFYSRIERRGDYGQISIISDFNKRSFCNYVCKERREPNDFAAFNSLIEILRQFAATPENNL